MSKLQDRLDRIRAGFAERAPEAARAIVARSTQELRDSGMLDRLPSTGDPLPHFELEDTDGVTLRSADLVKGGPLVITVYRGVW